MFQFICYRIAGAIPVILGVFLLTSTMIHFVPGDPVDSILGEFATAEDRTELRKKLQLDLPIHKQIGLNLKKLSEGSLGESLMSQSPVIELIKERIQPTFELAIISMIVAILLSIPLGILSAVFAGKTIDVASMFVALVGVSMPNFWLGPLLILLFSIHLDWLPVSERGDWSSYILPAITLGTALAAVLSRMTRNSLLDALNEDYIKTARAKGCHPISVVVKHAFRNASLPVVTIVGLQFGVLLTGAIITEKIFDWPGLGSLMLQGLEQRDYPVVQGCVLVFATTYVIVNLLTDLTYGILDPRIRYAENK